MVQFFKTGAYMTERDKSIIKSELGIISDTLEAIERRVNALKRHAVDVDQNSPTALDQAKKHYRIRREREKLFEKPDLFGEPAWDILVDLFIAAEEGKRISVSSLCIAAAAPPTTALRWISILENGGLIERTSDALDARRFYLALSTRAHDQLGSFFERTYVAT